MRDPHVEMRKVKKGDPYVDFAPRIWLANTGTSREPRKGEVSKLVEQGRYQMWDEPFFWYLIEHVSFRMIVRWYVQNWWYEVSSSVRYFFSSRFSVTASRIGMKHGDDFCIMPRYIEQLERSARRWRTIALSILAVLVISILIPYLIMR